MVGPSRWGGRALKRLSDRSPRRQQNERARRPKSYRKFTKVAVRSFQLRLSNAPGKPIAKSPKGRTDDDESRPPVIGEKEMVALSATSTGARSTVGAEARACMRQWLTQSGCCRTENYLLAHFARSIILAYRSRMNARSRVSEFDTPEQAAAYEQWLRAKVSASLADDTTPVAHAEAMKRARAIIEAKRAR